MKALNSHWTSGQHLKSVPTLVNQCKDLYTVHCYIARSKFGGIEASNFFLFVFSRIDFAFAFFFA